MSDFPRRLNLAFIEKKVDIKNKKISELANLIEEEDENYFKSFQLLEEILLFSIFKQLQITFEEGHKDIEDIILGKCYCNQCLIPSKYFVEKTYIKELIVEVQKIDEDLKKLNLSFNTIYSNRINYNISILELISIECFKSNNVKNDVKSIEEIVCNIKSKLLNNPDWDKLSPESRNKVINLSYTILKTGSAININEILDCRNALFINFSDSIYFYNYKNKNTNNKIIDKTEMGVSYRALMKEEELIKILN